MCIRGHYQESEKTTHRMRENICKLCIGLGINIKNMQKTKDNNKNSYNLATSEKQPNSKMDKGLE